MKKKTSATAHHITPKGTQKGSTSSKNTPIPSFPLCFRLSSVSSFCLRHSAFLPTRGQQHRDGRYLHRSNVHCCEHAIRTKWSVSAQSSRPQHFLDDAYTTCAPCSSRELKILHQIFYKKFEFFWDFANPVWPLHVTKASATLGTAHVAGHTTFKSRHRCWCRGAYVGGTESAAPGAEFVGWEDPVRVPGLPRPAYC